MHRLLFSGTFMNPTSAQTITTVVRTSEPVLALPTVWPVNWVYQGHALVYDP